MKIDKGMLFIYLWYLLLLVISGVTIFLLNGCSTGEQRLEKYQSRQRTIRDTVASQSQEMVYFTADSVNATNVKFGVRNPNKVIIPHETSWKDVANNLGGKVIGQFVNGLSLAAIFGTAKEGFNSISEVAGLKQGDTINTTTTNTTNDNKTATETITQTKQTSLIVDNGSQIVGGDIVRDSNNPTTNTTQDSNNPITTTENTNNPINTSSSTTNGGF